MRTIGNIERFLVVGIVVVIGAILTVAITGARDLNRERDAAAKAAPASKKGATPLKNELRAPRSSDGVDAAKKATDPQIDSKVAQADPSIKKLLDQRQAAIHGAPTGPTDVGTPPAPENRPDDRKLPKPSDDANNAGGGVGIADAPDVVRESKSTSPGAPESATLLDKHEPASGAAPGGQLTGHPSDALVATAALTKVYLYEVQKGDTLERIARALYGDGQRWKELATANPAIGEGHKIRAGDHLKLPSAPTHESAAVVAKDPSAAASPILPVTNAKPEAKDPASSAAAAAGFKRTTTLDQYQVQKGDTLMSIAAANYGTKAAWRLILDANSDKIPDKDRIKTGIVLKLPAN